MILYTVLYIVFSIITALVISYYFYFYKNSYSQNRVYKILFLLRAFSIFFLILLLLNPIFKNKSYLKVKPNLLLAVDESRSIAFLNQKKTVKSVTNKIKSDSKLNNKFKLQFFGFGENLEKDDTLVFTQNHSNIYKSLKQLNNLYENNSAIILISDGNQTNGIDYQFLKSKFPVYALAAGDTSKYEDLKISQVNHNDFTFINNQFPVEVFLHYQGNKDVNTRFLVYKNGKIIYAKPIKFSDKNKVKKLEFKLKSKHPGIHQYTVALKPIKGEKNLKNNKTYFSIKTLDNQYKILLVSNIKHPDIGMLKRSIETGKQRKLTVVIGDTKQINLKNYQLIILYQPTKNQKLLFKNIQVNKIPYITITGSQTDWNFLNNAQHIFHKDVNTTLQEYLPYVNKAYESFVINLTDLKDFPPLLSKFGNVRFVKKPRILIFSKVNNLKSQQALVATYKLKNNRRGAVIFGENIWKWRMAWFKRNKNFEGFDNFINDLIQYLSDYRLKENIKVNYKPVVYANEPIEFSAKLIDEAGNFDKRGKLEIKITKDDNQSTNTYPLISTGTQYKLTMNDLSPGNYKFKIFERKNGKHFNGKFVMLNFPVEHQFFTANFNKLQRFTFYNQGKTYLLKNYKLLINKLITDKRFKIVKKQIIKSTRLVSFKWLFLLAVVATSVEWFIRRYNGLI